MKYPDGNIKYQIYYFDSVPYDVVLANYFHKKPEYFCYVFSDYHNTNMKRLKRMSAIKLKDKEWDIWREDKANKNR